MNKKPILVSVFIFLSSTTFSLDLSTGYGLTLGANFDTLTSDVDNGAALAKQLYSQFNFGALVFFDATYVMADINFYGSSTTFLHNKTLKNYTNVNDDYQLIGANLAFGFYLKYPFNLGYISIFPIAGIQGSIGLAQNFSRDFDGINAKKGESYGDAKDWSTFIVKGGVGADVRMSGIMFFRAELFFDYKFNSALDKAFIDAVEKGGSLLTYNNNMGFEASFMLGYRIGAVSTTSEEVFTNSRQPRGGGDIYYPK
ncbi:MAG: hypothetical protein LBH18_05960 [Spirochaetaceae bacterium]|jgi:hypothetical protein|nr:hypothetical protein [Spirochaetaceae bacterium]